jgi:uncharacterized protein (UPF0212 family)
MNSKPNLAAIHTQKGWVHCPICTHTVEAEIVHRGRQLFTKPGQRCPRCASTLDAACILRLDKIAA